MRLPAKIAMDIWGDNQDNSERSITKIGTMLQSSLNELDAVLMVARRGKFRTAALELGVSTTALSNAVGSFAKVKLSEYIGPLCSALSNLVELFLHVGGELQVY